MCYGNEPSYEAIVADARRRKEQSFSDPNGVEYMDHLWGAVWNQDHLQPVLRTDEERFDDVAVRAWWSHGRYDWQQETDNEKSYLVFEIPDEVSRRLQSRHAQTMLRRFFGQNAEVDLPAPVLDDNSDETRKVFQSCGDDTTYDVIHDDWPTLKAAIEATAKNPCGSLGGQLIALSGAAGDRDVSQARVRGRDLELYITPHAVRSLQALWAQALKQEVLLEEHRRY